MFELDLIAAAIIYWQAREMARLLKNPPEEIAAINPSLVAHISPINWENVVLYRVPRTFVCKCTVGAERSTKRLFPCFSCGNIVFLSMISVE